MGCKQVQILLFAFLLVTGFMPLSVDAVGIVWSTEKEMVNELAPHCIEYGVYNPSSVDATVKLSVSDSLQSVTSGVYSHTEMVPAGTRHDHAVRLQLCFQVPMVYDAECLIGDSMLCEQACQQEEVSYTGEIMAVEVDSDETGGMGSSTTVGASVPLTLRVKCNPYNRDWSPVYITVIVVACVAIAGRVYMKKKK